MFTPAGLVRDMLDLVAYECERIDARFLEPACGDGNFLAEVLRRRLAVVDRKSGRSLIQWEQDALFSLACLYGIELLFDNVNACRDRLFDLFNEAYTARFRTRCRPETSAAARYIVRCNIHQGDALAMTTLGDHVYPTRPLVFTEWSMLPSGRFKRQQFEYHHLLQSADGNARGLFGYNGHTFKSDHGKPVFIAQSVRHLPVVHYLKLAETEGA